MTETTTKIRLDNMPEFLTVTDISTILHCDVNTARHFCKIHRDKLQPFKVGRENRHLAQHFLSLIEQLRTKKTGS